ncbi:AraC-type DNA-binding protein [Lampropedia hyalina DSM 16112]|uniref:AraC-type DNA-binding protein n=1 Tax=Lampropedia hyalina DSM 16112 TaxID=1122156 RepID=A0A1M5B4P7_9BURK|nr:AraC family transcriptional regulator [Lampropedia hyalina]SHF37473.1 AraC-type DNA-binding protein [Lampropedia hyalina DSM 16112]
MPATPLQMPHRPLALTVRSYGQDGQAHAHDFVQLVLPLHGALEIEVGGRGAWLDRMRAAYVPQGMCHIQASQQANGFLIVDVLPHMLDSRQAEQWAAHRFLPVSPAANHLIDYMAASLQGEGVTERAALWMPLLLDALANGTPQPSVRWAKLAATVDADLARHWTVADMAACVGVSASRLHVLFRDAFGTTPHDWLVQRRLEQARQWLAGTDRPIAEMAAALGFSDQSALTRAVRKATGMPPAAYRRQARSTPFPGTATA